MYDVLLVLIASSTMCKGQGLNASIVQSLDESILQSMDSPGSTGDELVRLIATYTGGMTSVNLKEEQAGRTQGSRSCDELYRYGRPRFVDHKYNTNKMEATYKWKYEDKVFFENIMIDARKAWENFEELYSGKGTRSDSVVSDY